MLKADFRPLTYSEIMELKPLHVKIDDYMYKCNLMKVKELSIFWANKDYIAGILDGAAKEASETKDASQLAQIRLVMLMAWKAMIALLWDISEKPGWWEKLKRKRWFHKYFLENVDKLLDLMDKVAVYKSRLFFLLQRLQNLSMVQESTYSRMDIEQCSAGSIQKPSISKLQQYENLKKKRLSESLNNG
jgi:hypothetical protein